MVRIDQEVVVVQEERKVVTDEEKTRMVVLQVVSSLNSEVDSVVDVDEVVMLEKLPHHRMMVVNNQRLHSMSMSLVEPGNQ